MVPGLGALPSISSGPAISGASNDGFASFGPVNVGGLFGSSAASSSNLAVPAIVAGIVLIAFFMRKK